MIERFFSILILGAIFAMFPMCLFYGGIYVSYFSFYEIKEYFNSFFMQNLNMLLYGVVGVFSGVSFIAHSNIMRYLYIIIVVLFSLTFIPSIGKEVGDRLFLKENARIVIDGKPSIVRVIYKDKYKVYYQNKGDKTIIRQNLNANR